MLLDNPGSTNSGPLNDLSMKKRADGIVIFARMQLEMKSNWVFGCYWQYEAPEKFLCKHFEIHFSLLNKNKKMPVWPFLIMPESKSVSRLDLETLAMLQCNLIERIFFLKPSWRSAVRLELYSEKWPGWQAGSLWGQL